MKEERFGEGESKEQRGAESPETKDGAMDY